MRIGNALGAVIAAPRLHGAPERRLMIQGAAILIVLSTIAFLWPKALAWPLGAFCAWMAVTLLVRASRLPGGRAPAAAEKEKKMPSAAERKA